MSLKQVMSSLDLTEEVLEAMLSFLQGEGLITALPSTALKLDVRFHGYVGLGCLVLMRACIVYS